MISTKFAYLPNGIIREIIEYTGATFKKRNGKYMGQIPKNDSRYTLLHKIPQKYIVIEKNILSKYAYFSSAVLLFKDDRYDIYTIRLHVSGMIFNNNVANTVVTNRFSVCDGNSAVRHYEYDETNNKFIEDLKQYRKGMKQFEEELNQLGNDIRFYTNITICTTIFMAVTVFKYIIKQIC